jgi:hypothetical protein
MSTPLSTFWFENGSLIPNYFIYSQFLDHCSEIIALTTSSCVFSGEEGNSTYLPHTLLYTGIFPDYRYHSSSDYKVLE